MDITVCIPLHNIFVFIKSKFNMGACAEILKLLTMHMQYIALLPYTDLENLCCIYIYSDKESVNHFQGIILTYKLYVVLHLCPSAYHTK